MKNDPLTLVSICERLMPIGVDLRSLADNLMFQICNNPARGVELIGELVVVESLIDSIVRTYDHVAQE